MEHTTPAPAPGTKTKEDLLFPLLVAGLFAVLCGLGALRHEMWRDEIQAWLIARDARSLLDLPRNMRYEGHPALWQFLLFFVSRFTRDPIGMQMLHVALATTSVFVIARYAPFWRPLVVLLCLGYFPLYEYGVISRNYAPAVLSIVLYCAWYPARKQRWYLLTALLMLLSNTSVYGMLVAFGLEVGLLFDRYVDSGRDLRAFLRQRQVIVNVVLFALGCLICLKFIIPPHDVGIHSGWTLKVSPGRVAMVLTGVAKAYFPLQAFYAVDFWNNYLLWGGPPSLKLFATGSLAGAGLIGLAVYLMRRSPISLVTYAAGMFGLMAFMYVKMIGNPRHNGHIWLLLIACLWIHALYLRSRPEEASAETGPRSSRWGHPLLLILAGTHVPMAFAALRTDWSHPFSRSRDAAAYIQTRYPADVVLTGAPGSAAMVVAGYLQRMVYWPEQKRTGGFAVWDKRELREVPVGELSDDLEQLLQSRPGEPAVVVAKRELNGWDDRFVVTEVADFPMAITDERFRLYEVRLRAQ